MLKKIIVSVGILVSILAIPALAKDGVNAQVHAGAQLNLSCVQTAVDAREQAIDSAFTTYSTAMATALSTRASALHDAWGITDATARRTARNAAWTAYKTAAHTASSTLKASKKSAWSTFSTASKACGVPVVESPEADTTGSISL